MSLHGKSAWLLEQWVRVLPAEERAIVLGDLQEDDHGFFSAAIAVLGYAVRRELMLWKEPDAWITLFVVVIPCSVMLSSVSASLADSNAISIWFFANNWDGYLLRQSGFWWEFRETLPGILWSGAALLCWSWCCGVLIRWACPRAVRINSLVLLLVFASCWMGWRSPTADFQALRLARDFPTNAAIFANAFYRGVFTPLTETFFVIIPFFCALQGRWATSLQSSRARFVFWLFVGISMLSLLAQASLWWQERTWNTDPSLTPHLPSAVPFAAAGCGAYLIAALAHIAQRTTLQKVADRC